MPGLLASFLHPDLFAGEVSEAALVRDILYVFQGIDGKFIKMSAQDNCYKIDSEVPASARVPVKLLIERGVQWVVHTFPRVISVHHHHYQTSTAPAAQTFRSTQQCF